MAPLDTIPEVGVLLSCARTRLTPEHEQRLRTLLRGEIDWTYLIWAARIHSLTPLLYRGLSSSCAEAVPAQVMSELRADAEAIALSNLFLANELQKLVTLFAEKQIPTIAHKGAALGASVYGNLAFRSFTDIDILVRKRDFHRAKGLLLSVGYKPSQPLTRKEERRRLPSHHAYPLQRDDGKVEVDLHWHVTNRAFTPLVELDKVCARLEVVDLGRARVHSFSPEDLLLILCVHGASHAWERLAWVCDIAELLSAKTLDWDLVERRGNEYGVKRILLLGLWLASNLLDANVPPHMLLQVNRDSKVGRLGREVTFRALGKPSDNSALFQCLFRAKTLERWGDKARYFSWLLRQSARVTRKDEEVLPLPAPLHFLYYIVRPFRLVHNYGRQVSRHLFSS